MKYIGKQLSQLFDTTNILLVLYHEDTNTIEVSFNADQKGEIRMFPVGKTLTSYVIKTRKPLLARREKLDKLAEQGLIETIGNKAAVWMGIPLIIKGKIIGAFVLQSYEDKEAYQEHDVGIMEMISFQISLYLERIRNEEEIRTALEKARESDRLKSVFLANMSHELRTPLNAVIGFSQLISEDSTIEEVLEFNKHIQKGGYHLLDIIEDILNISLLESGNVEISNVDINLGHFMDELFNKGKITQEKMQKEQLGFYHISPPASLQCTVHADAQKLHQVLHNLIKNAFKFTPEGSVHIGVEKISEDHGDVVRFFVRDTGIGIKKEKQTIIFDLFRQVDESHTRSYGGTGLGLSVSNKLVDLMGGEIKVESEPEKGSVFFVALPCKEFKKEIKDGGQEVVEEMTRLAEGKTVLVAEDEESNFELLNIHLEQLGLDVLWAKNGREAVELVKENDHIGLVLMDIKMPLMTGLEATEIIRKLKPQLPVIAQTAYAMPQDNENALRSGCTDIITKPIKIEELKKILEKYAPKSMK
jgi:signal transduction histidine kinase/CheY-like chemotaxis protein